MKKHKNRSLLDCKEGIVVTIDSIDDQEKNFLKFARSKHLVPGSKISILAREEVANAMELKIGKRNPFSIGFQAAKKILVSA